MSVPKAVFWWGIAGMTAQPAFQFLSGFFSELLS